MGCYDDAIRVKRNEMRLVIHNIFGGLNKEGAKLFALYKARARHGADRTDYVATDAGARDGCAFGPHWAQLLSVAVVKGDARRALQAVDKCRDDCLQASMRRVLAGPCPAVRACPPAPPAQP